MTQNLACNNPACKAPLHNTDFYCSLECWAQHNDINYSYPMDERQRAIENANSDLLSK